MRIVAPNALENAVSTGYPQCPASLNISASLEAPERQHNRLKTLLHTFFVSFANQGGCNFVLPSQINELLLLELSILPVFIKRGWEMLPV